MPKVEVMGAPGGAMSAVSPDDSSGHQPKDIGSSPITFLKIDQKAKVILCRALHFLTVGAEALQRAEGPAFHTART